ncbi:MAG: hypothetical protein ABSE89_11025 [Sedimentisphaerales bacterium]
MENNKIIDGNCWVAYFDILGFENAVKNLSKDAVYELFFAEPFYRRSRLNDIINENKDVRHKFFSDSFVFYTENDSRDSFRNIKMVSEVFFRTMFLEYIPMRGCLNVGQFYADEEKDIFFGPAIIEAYHLAEGQNWIGFVLSEEVERKCKTNNDTLYLDTLKQYKRYLEYEVPYKDKDNKEGKRVLLAYKIEDFPFLNEQPGERLLSSLAVTESAARYLKKINSGKDQILFENIVKKYENTREFILDAYPALKEKIKKQK